MPIVVPMRVSKEVALGGTIVNMRPGSDTTSDGFRSIYLDFNVAREVAWNGLGIVYTMDAIRGPDSSLDPVDLPTGVGGDVGRAPIAVSTFVVNVFMVSVADRSTDFLQVTGVPATTTMPGAMRVETSGATVVGIYSDTMDVAMSSVEPVCRSGRGPSGARALLSRLGRGVVVATANTCEGGEVDTVWVHREVFVRWPPRYRRGDNSWLPCGPGSWPWTPLGLQARRYGGRSQR